LHRAGLVGEWARFAGLLDDAEAVAQPLHRRAGDKDRAFERLGVFTQLVGNGARIASTTARSDGAELPEEK